MVSAAVARGRLGSAVSTVGSCRTVETRMPDPKMPWTQREVKPPWMPQESGDQAFEEVPSKLVE